MYFRAGFPGAHGKHQCTLASMVEQGWAITILLSRMGGEHKKGGGGNI